MLLGIITSPWSEIVTTLVISTAGLPAHILKRRMMGKQSTARLPSLVLLGLQEYCTISAIWQPFRLASMPSGDNLNGQK